MTPRKDFEQLLNSTEVDADSFHPWCRSIRLLPNGTHTTKNFLSWWTVPYRQVSDPKNSFLYSINNDHALYVPTFGLAGETMVNRI